MEKITVIDSSKEKNTFFYNLLEGLKKSGSQVNFYTTRKRRDRFVRDGWPVKKIFLGPEVKNLTSRIIFMLLFPFIFLLNFFYFAYLKIIKKIKLIVCVNLNEKLLFFPVAKLLGIKIIWIENIHPAIEEISRPGGMLKSYYRRASKKARVMAFNNYSKNRLKSLGILEDNIYIIPIGIKLSQSKYQDNIFTEIAQNNGEKFKRKFFTVGTIVDLGKNQNLEVVFQAVKKSLSVIPNLQLIIIGEGEEKKNLSWLNKKMELDGLTWFVGEQKHTKKWLDGFDCFLVADEAPEIKIYENVLTAMLSGLPIIGPLNWGLEEILPDIYNNLRLLSEPDNSEELAQKIINLCQDKRLRIKLGQLGSERVEKSFSLEGRIIDFQKIINF